MCCKCLVKKGPIMSSTTHVAARVLHKRPLRQLWGSHSPEACILKPVAARGVLVDHISTPGSRAESRARHAWAHGGVCMHSTNRWPGALEVELLPHAVGPVGAQHALQVLGNAPEGVPDQAALLADAAVEGHALRVGHQALLQAPVALCGPRNQG